MANDAVRDGHAHVTKMMDAESYDKLTGVQEVVALGIRAVLRHIDDGRSSLKLADYGCGTGEGSLAVARAVGKENISLLLGLDVSDEMLHVFERKGIGHNVSMKPVKIPENVSDLPASIGDVKLDCVFSTLVFHHVPNPKEALAAISKTLGPGGKVLIVDFVPQPKEIKEAWMRKMRGGKAFADNDQKHGHGHGHGHDHEQDDKAPHAHDVPGYTAEQVRSWFSQSQGLTDFFYELAYEYDVTPEGHTGEKMVLKTFVAGMTKS